VIANTPLAQWGQLLGKKRKEEGMQGKFELKTAKDGQFMFNLKATNG
jgi:hypothetical protein